MIFCPYFTVLISLKITKFLVKISELNTDESKKITPNVMNFNPLRLQGV